MLDSRNDNNPQTPKIQEAPMLHTNRKRDGKVYSNDKKLEDCSVKGFLRKIKDMLDKEADDYQPLI
jgi:hypothetical protein